MVKNDIYLKYRNKILSTDFLFIGELLEMETSHYVSTMLHNIAELGFMFDNEIINILGQLHVSDLEKFYLDMIKTMKEMVGAHVVHKPMYPNFPEQVMDMDASELYFNALIHYITKGMPQYEVEERLPMFSKTKPVMITIGDELDFCSIFTNLVASKTSISETDQKTIIWFIQEYKEDIFKYLPTEMPNKEVMLFTVAQLMEYLDMNKFQGVLFNTVTDVLRLVTALSKGDVSLASNTQYKSFTRSERRVMLEMMENCKNKPEDMLRHRMKWIRLGEKLHPGDYAKQFPSVIDAFDLIRNNPTQIKTFNGQLERFLEQKDLIKVLNLLKKRPGIFARRLDHLLRLFGEHSAERIAGNFIDTVRDNDISTTVLWQVRNHFLHRNNTNKHRLIFPKGNIAKTFALENKLPKIDEYVCMAIVDICDESLIKQYSVREKMGKVYVDPQLDDYLVPFSQRSASEGFKTITRGSRLEMPPVTEGKNTVRFFIHWKNCKNEYRNTVDLDLSAALFDSNWGYKQHISYTNLSESNIKGYHSGDITSAPKGASEFIDINIPSAHKIGARYIVMNVLSYNNQPFNVVPECFAGFMMRDRPQSGEMYEPKTVINKIDVTSDTTYVIPLIIDIVERKVVWCDLSLTGNPNWVNNIEGNMRSMNLTCKAICDMRKTTIYDLLRIHAVARGEKVNKPEDADVVFSVENGTQFELDTIMGEYL